MMRDSLVFYASFYEAIEVLAPNDQLKAYKAIINYALNGVEPSVEIGIAYAIYLAIKPQIDANNQRYENSTKGGRPSKKPMVSKKEENEKPMVLENNENEKPMVSKKEQIQKPNVNENVNVNVNVNENVNDNKKENDKRKKFTPPTLEEVTEYCNERTNTVNPQRFIDFYSSKGWMVGSNKMKDWKACVRTWEQREQPKRDEPIPIYSSSNNMQVSNDDIAKYLGG